MGNVSEETREERKEGRKKGSNPQLQVCYTFVAPAEVHNRVDDKGPGPMLPIVAWRTIWRLWMANPSGPLTGWAFKQPGDSFLHWAGPLSDRDGKTRATYSDWAFAQSWDWETIVEGKYYLHCQAVAVFVMSEDELGEEMPPEGDWNPAQTVWTLFSHAKRVFSQKNVPQNKFDLINVAQTHPKGSCVNESVFIYHLSLSSS